jgi:hypothetical protein
MSDLPLRRGLAATGKPAEALDHRLVATLTDPNLIAVVTFGLLGLLLAGSCDAHYQWVAVD